MILCFDTGGSRIKAGRAGADGAVVALGTVPTPPGDFAACTGVLSGFAGDWTQGIAISIAGVVDPDFGLIKVANIPFLNSRNLVAELGRALRCPVRVFNDADCLALAEAGRGAGRGHRNVFGAIPGTGVGHGLVIDGRIITGAGLCCPNPVRDSSFESSMIAGGHERTEPTGVQDPELARV